MRREVPRTPRNGMGRKSDWITSGMTPADAARAIVDRHGPVRSLVVARQRLHAASRPETVDYYERVVAILAASRGLAAAMGPRNQVIGGKP